MILPKPALLNHRKQVKGKTVYYYFLVSECRGFLCTDNNDRLSKKPSLIYV